MTRSLLLAALAGAALVSSLPAQDLPAPPKATLMAGVGNSLGWFGMGGELFVGDARRVSVAGGLGYAIGDSEFDGTVAGAVALRGFTRGVKHRGFLEASVSLLAMELTTPDLVTFDQRNAYGPALVAGYRFTSRGGFTFMASGGLGYAPSLEVEDQAVPVVNIGFGYTWRR